MEKQIYPEKSGREMVSTLEAMADGVENMIYGIQLTDQELADRKTRFTQLAIQEARIADEKKKANEEFKNRMKPISTEKIECLQVIKTGTIETEGRVFKFIDHATKMAGYYNERGQLVYTRGANTEELAELTIAHNRRTGTND